MGSIEVTQTPSLDKAAELEDLLNTIQGLLIPFVSNADIDFNTADEPSSLHSGKGANGISHTGIPPQELLTRLNFQLPENGLGKKGLVSTVGAILSNSVNTWSQGFMHKLYASTNAVGVVSELLLAVLNTALHVYEVSPALTAIEKETSKALASLFCLTGEYAGGITAPGGSASNLTALVIARNTLYPETKTIGYGSKKFVMFTSAEGHYSHEKAAQVCGLGSLNCWPVTTDSQGRMQAGELQSLILRAREQGYTPIFVNATAGTTVLGAYDPLLEIGQICKAEKLWFHIDASWGGAVVFSDTHKHKMRGSELADSLTINPHKMLGAPVSCSFLLAADLRQFWRANTLPAGYLFHNSSADAANSVLECGSSPDNNMPSGMHTAADSYREVWDLGDLTLQCGRRGDSLKLALGWIYYGKRGYASQIDGAFDIAYALASRVSSHPDLVLVSELPAPCLQVCFYYAKGGSLGNKEENTRATRSITYALVKRGFMVDHAPGPRGAFFRVVVNLYTLRETVERLVEDILYLGERRERERMVREQEVGELQKLQALD